MHKRKHRSDTTGDDAATQIAGESGDGDEVAESSMLEEGAVSPKHHKKSGKDVEESSDIVEEKDAAISAAETEIKSDSENEHRPGKLASASHRKKDSVGIVGALDVSYANKGNSNSQSAVKHKTKEMKFTSEPVGKKVAAAVAAKADREVSEKQPVVAEATAAPA